MKDPHLCGEAGLASFALAILTDSTATVLYFDQEKCFAQ